MELTKELKRLARGAPPGAANLSDSASVVFETFTGDGIKFVDVRAVEIVDLRIIYKKGAPIAYVRLRHVRTRRSSPSDPFTPSIGCLGMVVANANYSWSLLYTFLRRAAAQGMEKFATEPKARPSTRNRKG
jgi:hypothetical protein